MNQCDGCRRGLPVNQYGVHIGPKGFWFGEVQACTKHLYNEKNERTEDSSKPATRQAELGTS